MFQAPNYLPPFLFIGLPLVSMLWSGNLWYALGSLHLQDLGGFISLGNCCSMSYHASMIGPTTMLSRSFSCNLYLTLNLVFSGQIFARHYLLSSRYRILLGHISWGCTDLHGSSTLNKLGLNLPLIGPSLGSVWAGPSLSFGLGPA